MEGSGYGAAFRTTVRMLVKAICDWGWPEDTTGAALQLRSRGPVRMCYERRSP